MALPASPVTPVHATATNAARRPAGRRPQPTSGVPLSLPTQTQSPSTPQGLTSPLGASLSSDASPPSSVTSRSSNSGRTWTVKPVSTIERGACGVVSIIEWADEVKGKKPMFRVMKEIANTDHAKARREREQFDRQSSHPNIVKYYYYGPALGDKASTHMQVQMELMDMGSLKRIMELIGPNVRSSDRLTLCECVGYQLFMALHYFHEYFGGMHRDVKPANILLNSAGRVKLCDFDTSVADSLLHDTGIGTQSYSAPEVIRSERYTSSCDIWSTGTVLFELATGRHPYFSETAATQMVTLFQRMTKVGEGITWHLLDEDTPQAVDLKNLLQACLAENPAQRITAAGALAHPFFSRINRNRKQDREAESQMRRVGITVDSSNPSETLRSWRKRMGLGHGSPAAGSGNDANRSFRNAAESPNGVAEAAPPATPTPPPMDDDEKRKVQDVMKTLLFLWEHHAVSTLKDWLQDKGLRSLLPDSLGGQKR